MRVYLNGEYLEQARAAVSVDDRGFLFGDGVYEVTRARNGRLFEAGRHLRRLERGLEALGIAPPPGFEPGGGALLEIADRLLRDNGLMNGDALVYLEITRGVAERTHHFPPAGTPPTVFLRTNRLAAPDDVRERGATVITTPDRRWERCDLKTVQLLPNVLAKQQAVTAGAFEAVFVRAGIVTEGASTNVFVVIDGAIHTHPATQRILPGITREIVLELAAERRLRVEEKADHSPVSDVDKAIEEMARALARERHPGLGVFGEEQGDDPGTAGARLIVDPIDGTVSFVRGIPVFGTLLAIEAEGEVVAGVASAPALGARWHAARGLGAFSGARRLRVSQVGDLQQAMLFHCDLGSGGGGGGGPPAGIMRLMRRVNRTRGLGDFYQHVLVAEGAGEIAIDRVVHPWDIAALQVIVEEAGGRATGLGGERSIYAGTLVSSNGLVHDAALAVLRGGEETIGKP